MVASPDIITKEERDKIVRQTLEGILIEELYSSKFTDRRLWHNDALNLSSET